MKKTITAILSSVITAAAIVTAVSAVPYAAGDANGDGKVSSGDVLTLKKSFAGLDVEVTSGGDVNRDGKINSTDILLLKKSFAGIIEIDTEIEQFNIGGVGLSHFDIVRAPDASENVKFAAKEMRDYLTAAFGTSLEIKDSADSSGYHIFISNDGGEELGVEGFIIKVENGNLYIIGGNERGALYGAYEFLESYAGYRFYIQNMEEFIASDEPLDVVEGTYDKQIPKISYRDSQTFGYQWNSKNPDTDYVGNAVKRKISSFKNRGILERSEMYGYGEGYNGTAHSFNYLIDFDNTATPGQPCFTDESIYEKTLAAVLARLEKSASNGYPIDAITVSQEDNDRYCACESCREIAQAEGQSGVILTFVNNIADAVGDIYPDTDIWTLAYMTARKPPETIVPRDNVIICYAWVGCNNHLFTSDECTGTTLPNGSSTNAQDREYFEKWCQIANKIQVWYYPVEYDFMMAPCPLLFNIREDIAYLESFDAVDGIYFEGNWGTEDNKRDGYGFECAQAYLETKVMWDPDMSEEEYTSYMMDFFRYYYGDGCDEIYQFALMQDAAADAEGCWINQWDYLFDRYNFDYFRENFEQMIGLLDSAREKAATDDQRKHIDMLAASTLFMGLSATLEDNYTNGTAESKALHEARYDRLISIINDCDLVLGYKGDAGFASRGYNVEGTAVNYSEMPFWWYGLSSINRH